LNRKIVLPLFFVLSVSLFSGVEFASAAGSIGVVVGQSADYTYAVSGTIRNSDGTINRTMPYSVAYLEKITVVMVSGTNVTFQFERDSLNGTTDSGTSWVDVSDGNGTGYFVVVSSNVNAGGLLYPDAQVSENIIAVNETVSLQSADGPITANHLNYVYTIDNQTYSEDYYWEKSTGLMLKWTISGSEAIEDGTLETLTVHFQRIDLQHIFYPFIDNKEYAVTVDSNSTILGFEFNQTEKNLSMNVTGLSGTAGYCDVLIPDGLLFGTFSLSMDGYDLVEGTDYSQTHEGGFYNFDIPYIHSTHTLTIAASDAVPEFPAWLILPLFMVATLLTVMLYRKRLNKLE
jgi:hypothetical protein